MTRNQTLITICIAFVMGCIAGPMASQVVVRPARAEPNGARKWEQYCSFRKVGYWDDVINDTNQDPRFNQEVDRRTGFRTRNILYVPLRNRLDQTIGVAQVLDKHEGCFTQLDAASAIIRRQRSPSSTRRLPPTRQDSNAICSATGIRQSGISVTLSMRHRRIVLLGFLSIVADTTATIRHWMPGTAFGSWSRKVAVHHHGQPRQRES